MTDNKDLVLIAQESGLEKSKTEVLLTKFSSYFNEAKQLVKVGKEIVVTDENDLEGMAKAREIRRQLQDIRTKGVEPTRKALKEQSLREGRAIDGIANVIKALIVTEEERLMAQEKFAERLQAERDNKIEAERHNQLSKYVDDSEIYSLHPSNLTDEAFEKLLGNSKLAYEAQKKAEQEAEAERIENEKKEKIFNERKFELVKYSDFIELAELTIETTEQQFEKLKTSALTAYKKYQEEQEKIRKENEKLQKEKEKAEAERLKAEQELAKQREAQELKERQEREAQEAKKRAEEELERKSLLAPDKQKLLEFAKQIQSTTAPAVKSKEADMILEKAMELILEAVEVLQQGAKKL
jgi:hypothetical protein